MGLDSLDIDKGEGIVRLVQSGSFQLSRQEQLSNSRGYIGFRHALLSQNKYTISLTYVYYWG